MAEINYYANHIIQGTLSTSGSVTLGGTLTVQNGNINLGSGTGRIQGVDTVNASTDAANRAYVDAHPDGTVTSVGLTSQGDAIAIIGTPVTTSGNLGITFQGDASDFINGEGDLESFPFIPQGTVTGTGSAGRVAFWDGSSVLSSDVNLFWKSNSGRLGIGTITPLAKLDIEGMSTTVPALKVNAVSGDNMILDIYNSSDVKRMGLEYDNSGINFNIVNRDTDKLFTVREGGNVGVGTASPIEKFQVNGNTAIYGAIKGYTGSSSNQYLSILQSSNLTYISTGTTNETIYFGIGPVSNVTNINVAGTATATNFILSSDKTLKDKIKNIKASHVDIKWKNFELISEPGVKRSGVIAQELEEKHPEFVRTDKDGLKSVAYIDLLITKIAELEERIKKLEN